MTAFTFRSLACLLGLSSVPTVLAGQQVVTIESQPSCGSCSIRLTPLATVGSAGDSVLLVPYSWLVWAPWGQFYAAPVATPGVVAVYDQTGKQTGSLGHAGSGPGEFFGIRNVVPIGGGGLLVNDGPRLSILTTTGRPVRSAPLPLGVATFNIAALPDGRFVVNNRRATGVARLVLLDTALALVRPLGQALAQSAPDRDALAMVLAAGDSGTIIAAQALGTYAIEVWDTTGALRRRIIRNADWFRPYAPAERQRRGLSSPPLPAINSTYYAGEGLLWIAGTVADRRWTPPAPAADAGERSARTGIRERQSAGWDVAFGTSHFDTMIEVLDLTSGRLVTTLRLDQVASFIGGGLLAWQEQDDDGVITYRVGRPSIVRR